MALSPALQTQMQSLNTNVNKLLDDRARIFGLFDDGLGATLWSLLPAANQTAVKTALVNDMQTAVTNLQAVITALQAM